MSLERKKRFTSHMSFNVLYIFLAQFIVISSAFAVQDAIHQNETFHLIEGVWIWFSTKRKEAHAYNHLLWMEFCLSIIKLGIAATCPVGDGRSAGGTAAWKPR